MTPQPNAYHIYGGNRKSNIVVVCDHASNRVPDQVGGGNLGLPARDMARHIAFDVGAAGVSRHLGRMMAAPVILSNFSRLVIDPNRGEDDPTLIMQLYDGSLIPGNRHLGAKDIKWRLNNCYHPYHNAVAALLASRQNPILIAVHSFTAQLNGNAKRPWHIGILYGDDQRLARPVLARLRQQKDLCIGENEPYHGHLSGDSLERHTLKDNIPTILIELRNDLIETDQKQQYWAERLAPILIDAINETPL